MMRAIAAVNHGAAAPAFVRSVTLPRVKARLALK